MDVSLKILLFTSLIALSQSASSTTEVPATATYGTTESDGETEPPTGLDEICGAGYCYTLREPADVWETINDDDDCTLAVLDTAEKVAFVHAELPKLFPSATDPREVWIGASREDNTTTWITDGEIPDDADEWTTVPDHEDGCVLLTHTGTDTVGWTVVPCDGSFHGLCEEAESTDDDDGLSDGAIAGIAVGTTAVVGGAAAGGGYYAYSKSKSSGVAPAAGAEGTDVEKQEEEKEGGDGGEEETPQEEDAQE